MQLLHFFVIFIILVNFPIFMFFMIFQRILPVLLTLDNYCFHTQVIPRPDWLGVVDQTFTKLDIVTSDFIWSQPNMVSVLILDSQKHGHNQIYLYSLFMPKGKRLKILLFGRNWQLSAMGQIHPQTDRRTSRLLDWIGLRPI